MRRGTAREFECLSLGSFGLLVCKWPFFPLCLRSGFFDGQLHHCAHTYILTASAYLLHIIMTLLFDFPRCTSLSETVLQRVPSASPSLDTAPFNATTGHGCA